jgi:hypothetical protein
LDVEHAVIGIGNVTQLACMCTYLLEVAHLEDKSMREDELRAKLL